MTLKFLSFFIFFALVFSTGCGPSAEEIAQQQLEEHILDSTRKADSIAHKIIADSIARRDSIRNFPGPELEEYTKLSQRIIALLRSSENNVSDKFGVMADSLGEMHTALFKKTFASLDGICKHRLMALDMRYTRDMTNAIMARSGPAGQLIHSESEDAKVDSMSDAIEFGE